MGNKTHKTNVPAIEGYELFDFYVLPDNNPETIAQIQLEVKDDNAVLAYPDPEDQSSGSSGKRKYKACFIQEGQLLSANNALREVALGNQQFPVNKLMQANAVPNSKNLISMALAKAGIVQSTLLTKVPQQVIAHKILQSNLDVKSIVNFAQSSFLAKQAAQPAIKKAKLEKLLNHVIRSEQAAADKLLASIKNPDELKVILSAKLIVIDYSNRQIEGTALRLALGAKDVKFIEDEECMVEMLQKHLARLGVEGETMFQQQYAEQFPEGWEEEQAEKEAIDVVELHKLFDTLTTITEAECQAVHGVDDAIQDILRARNGKTLDPRLKALSEALLQGDKAGFESAFSQLQSYLEEENMIQEGFRFEGLKALYQFRNHLESQTKTVIKTGFHFNDKLLEDAFRLYDANYANFGSRWDSAKNMVSWRKGVGYVQRFLPACLAQAFHHGVYYLVEERQKLQRLSEFKHSSGYKLLPLSFSSSVPGYDWAAGALAVIDATSGEDPVEVPLFSKLMSSKNSRIGELTPRVGLFPRTRSMR